MSRIGKKTHKLKGLGDVAAVVDASSSLTVAAKRLGVNRSTLHRWLQAGKVQRSAPKTGPAAGASPDQSAEGWGKAVQEAGELDATRVALVGLAVAALTMARDAMAPAAVRLSAMGRYQQLVRQLNLVSEGQVAPEVKPIRAVAARRPGSDPRALLMAVK